MRYAPAVIAVSALTALAGAARAEPAVEIRDAAARVVVIPEARSDVKVEMVTTNAALPLTVRNEFDHVIVDGHLRHRIGGCNTMFGKTVVRVRGVGQVSYENLPQIVVRTPMDAHVQASKAVFGSVGRSHSLVISNAGCGDWTVANVSGRLEVNDDGSGDIRIGSAGGLEARVAGSGDISAREIRGPVGVSIAGSGDVTAASVEGTLRANIAGSGDVKIAEGHVSQLTAHIAGSGDVRFAGVADDVSASIAGSGDVDVARVTGEIHKTVFGSGSVNVGR